jgi:organic hydroperoxide reductase OsmC/OhrA
VSAAVRWTGRGRQQRLHQRPQLVGHEVVNKSRHGARACHTVLKGAKLPLSGGYTYKSRFEGGPGSNPKQLIAANHAACFSMALTLVLAQTGSPPDFVRTAMTSR